MLSTGQCTTAGGHSEELYSDSSTDGASQANKADFQPQATQADISLQASNAAWSPSQDGAPVDSHPDTSNTSGPSGAMTDAIEPTSVGSPADPGDQSAIRRTASDTSAAGQSINQTSVAAV